MRVLVVAEYYPRAADPALGVWAHRQAVAARDAGAEVEVLVLHRPVPSKAALRARDPKALAAPFTQPLKTTLDGIAVTYVPFVAPPRPRSYGSWGAWAAPTLALALRRKRFDLVHAHYAAPAGDAVRRAGIDKPLVISVHGGDVLAVPGYRGGTAAVTEAFKAARLTLANSTAIAERSRELGARDVRVVHLGTDVPPPSHTDATTLVTVGNLIARKRHGDVLRALWLLRDQHPELHYVIVGDGPERAALEHLADDLELSDRVAFRGALPPQEALAVARWGGIFVLPSIDEAFGVAYIEAMAGGIPAIGSRGEPGPEEIASCGGGMRLVAPGDPESLANELRELLDDATYRKELGAAARANVEQHFTWERCGRETVRAYEDALR
ncbi:glycosyltransferase [Solirubrobacter soli]|uniref:glycosyltransferase n=1 Tax=Solirubrobacter soli TaxID=363832 RepID=UPI0004232940|nr:glycosyltransferase [Solirubrobacter soli]